MPGLQRHAWMGKALAVVGVGFGALTIVTGARVLLGADPGWLVYRPLLVYNTLMGAAYVAAGVLVWRGSRWGIRSAAAIVLLNLAVLIAVVAGHTAGAPIAENSVRAMVFRTVVWLALLVGLAWLGRGKSGGSCDRRP